MAALGVGGGLFEREAALDIVVRLDLCDLAPLAAACSAVAAALRNLAGPFGSSLASSAEVHSMDLMCSVMRAMLRSGEISLRSLRRAGMSVLSWAAAAGRPDVVRWLLLEAPECETQLDLPDGLGATALHYAALGGHEHVCELLLQHGASPDLADGTGTRPLHLAAEGGHDEACRALLQGRAQIDVRAGDKATPLLLAAQEGHCEVCALLVRNRADPLASSIQGDSALSLAHKWHSQDLLHALERALWRPQQACAILVAGPEAQEIMRRAMRQRALL